MNQTLKRICFELVDLSQFETITACKWGRDFFRVVIETSDYRYAIVVCRDQTGIESWFENRVGTWNYRAHK